MGVIESVPDVVIGPPDNPVPALIVVTVPAFAFVQEEFEPSVVKTFVLLPAWEGNKLFKAAFAVVAFVPPFTTGMGLVIVIVGVASPLEDKGADAATEVIPPGGVIH